MMVLSGFLKASNEQRQKTTGGARSLGKSPADITSCPASSPANSSLPSDCLYDESQLVEEISDDPDLRDLNNSLVALAAIFPDVNVEVFREMLSSFDCESRLAVVAEALLKNKLEWVKGRYRIAGKEKSVAIRTTSGTNGLGGLSHEERFRTSAYINAVKITTYAEFKGLSHSTIKAVLAEHNHSYTLARPILSALHVKTWRHSFTSLFSRSKRLSSEDFAAHPHLVWRSTGNGAIIPTLGTTGNAELDRELFLSLVAPLRRKNEVEQVARDHAFALALNNLQAEESDALHDCECCYIGYTFEELVACDHGGHLICSQCVKRTVDEAVYGQGWQRSIDHSSGALRCLASSYDDCKGCVPPPLIRCALIDAPGGEEALQRLDERLAEENLLKSNLPLVRCPFCAYAEVDEIYLPSALNRWRFRVNGPLISSLPFLVIGLGMIPFVVPVFLLCSFTFMIFCTRKSFSDVVSTWFHDALSRLRRRKHGLRFTCQNPQCSRASCMSCSKAWSDIHICHESSLLALRTQVELAMSQAIKRTCPRCNTSFVKSSGCNKLTCVCGYQMCYVCRKDIGNGEGYRHFCEHFRPTGGRGCGECNKCDLYRCEDDEVVVARAKAEAETRWLEKEGMAIEGRDDVRRSLLGKSNERSWFNRSGWEWEKVTDTLMDCIIE